MMRFAQGLLPLSKRGQATMCGHLSMPVQYTTVTPVAPITSYSLADTIIMNEWLSLITGTPSLEPWKRPVPFSVSTCDLIPCTTNTDGARCRIPTRPRVVVSAPAGAVM